MEKALKVPLLSEQYSDREEQTVNQRPQIRVEENIRRNLIKCSTCSCELQYPEGTFIIKCFRCFQVTAVKELSCLVCVNCKNSFFFPVGTPCVACACGQIYMTRQAPNQNYY